MPLVIADLARHACAALGRGMVALTLAGFVFTWFGKGLWFLEGAAYWIPAYAALAFLGTGCCLLGRARRWAVAGVICTCAAVAMMIPCYLPCENRAAAGQQANLRILEANVFGDNRNPSALLRLVREAQPDVVVLQEADEHWEGVLHSLASYYPRHVNLMHYPGGSPELALYWRIDSDEAVDLSANDLPAVMAKLRVDGRAVNLLNAHTASPFSPGRARRHREQMLKLTEFLKDADTPVILAGDLNSGPWSRLYRRLTREARLISARQGLGVLGTWPSFFGPLRTSIDHVLVSPDIQVVRCWVGPPIGSDHRPLLADLYIPPPAERS